MTYQIKQIQINPDQYQIQVLIKDQLVTFKQLMDLLKDSKFVDDFSSKLEIEFEYYFETNGIKSPETPVLIILSRIKMTRKADSKAFQEYFNQSDSVVFFPNLAQDAYLVVPKPVSSNVNYLNLLTFLRTSSKEQIHQFWSKVAHVAIEYLKYNPVIYLKTHGFAVPWLHFRIQKNRKYYFTKEKDYQLVL